MLTNICVLNFLFLIFLLIISSSNCGVVIQPEFTLISDRYRDTSPVSSSALPSSLLSQLSTTTIDLTSRKKSFRSNELCDMNNGKKLYIEKGDYGELIGKAFVVHSKYFDEPQLNDTTKLSYECSTDIITCPSCVIKLNITVQLHDDLCTSDYLLIGEPPYLNDNSSYGRKFCQSMQIQLKSLTRNLHIKFIYSTNHSLAFHIEYVAEKNQVKLNDNHRKYNTPIDNSLENPIFISSPYFPMYYPRDYGIEYIIKCNPKNSPSTRCFIRITFTDFQISSASTFEAFDYVNDTEQRKTHVYSGSMFRPPIIFSVNSTMILRFYANGGTGLGFRGEIHFIAWLPKHGSIKGSSRLNPSLDCGGFVETLGGAITMMNMLSYDDNLINTTGGGKMRKYFDCIWIIKPPNTFLHLKTHLLTRVDSFDKMVEGSQLVLKQGLTSNKPILEILLAVSGNLYLKSKTYIAPFATGFYVSFKGSFGIDTKLAISYAAFSYMDCFIGSEFLCQNHRCIPIQLHCDGFDHCGDGSDEPSTCPTTWKAEDFESKWYSHTPNYYFPKTERYPDLKAATIIFMLSCLGLILLITALIVLLYRMGARARHQRELQNHLQTISELLDNNRNENLFTDEPPPTYEAPPDYDEVIKVGINDDFYQKGLRRSERRKKRQRISETTSESAGNSHDFMEVDAPENTNSVGTGHNNHIDLLTPTYRLEATSSNAFSAHSQVSSCNTTATPSSCIPDSPPPTYHSSNIMNSGVIKTNIVDLLLPIPVDGEPTTSSSTVGRQQSSNWLIFNSGEPTSTISSFDELKVHSEFLSPCHDKNSTTQNARASCSNPNIPTLPSLKLCKPSSSSIFDTSIFRPIFTSSETTMKRHLCGNCQKIFHTSSTRDVMQSVNSVDDSDLNDENEIELCCPICGDAATIPFLRENSTNKLSNDIYYKDVVQSIPRSLSYEHMNGSR